MKKPADQDVIKTIYAELWKKHFPLVAKNELSIDPYLLDLAADTRRGLTLICRPSQTVWQNVAPFLEAAKRLEPSLYVYPASAFHVTILSLISCFPDFQLKDIEVERYVELVDQCLAKVQAIPIEFRGLTLSAAAILLQGIPQNDQLRMLRDGLRGAFQNSTLFQSIDQRYPLQTAHCTLIRFSKKLQNPVAFSDLLQQYQDQIFGIHYGVSFELVFNDWYQQKSKQYLIAHWEI